ncbi:arsenate reductase [Amylibacter marinus]|uniref:Arsenate reductase n=1 Tax=Amylibacter marinus TaxID=1475483 RepID=A0ABQ5VUZ9_9RHOB|nr:arsenate reductase (glutaredoxin) [Amylibacter marinus]GLQ34954.1 arsenate reductase [Amylibacter marinus]
MTTIWHNPRCSKSRQTLALIEDRAPEIRRYLDDNPSADELRSVIDMLGGKAIDIIRHKDARFKELGLTLTSDSDQLIAAMVEHPILIERPIVISNGQARIGRPPEAVFEIFS